VKLFDEMPRIEGEHLILREMAASDAPALSELAHSGEVRRFLPTFLYEQLGDDPVATIERMREKCFDTKESILLAICDREAPDVMMGIAEIYAYEERKPKASIGVRILKEYWAGASRPRWPRCSSATSSRRQACGPSPRT
jgi:ribosomal-protein-alanine N-acetyltransferase